MKDITYSNIFLFLKQPSLEYFIIGYKIYIIFDYNKNKKLYTYFQQLKLDNLYLFSTINELYYHEKNIDKIKNDTVFIFLEKS